jgi:phosphoglycerate dehydrogenase-like enzyme
MSLSAPAPLILFAEMPEAEGRDIAAELHSLPSNAVVRRYVHRGDVQALLEAARDASAIITDYVPFTAEVLAALPNTPMISVLGTGYDSVDVNAAARLGIPVAAVGEYCTDEVADHTLALLLALNRRLLDYHRQVQVEHDFRWNRVQGVHRLSGQTLGLVGFGRIGQAVARRAQGFGLKVVAHDPVVEPSRAAALDVELLSLDELYARADIVSLHCNLSPQNRGMLDAGAFARTVRRPLLLNVARGGLVNEAALAEALDAGRIAGAALDVLATDSPELPGHPLAGRDDVLLTPHVAFYSETSMAELARICAGNVTAWLEGRADEVFRWVNCVERGA